MEAIIKFLELNGFRCILDNIFQNNKCYVQICHSEYYYILQIDSELSMYSEDLNIYWLIGVLTYYGYIDKNYKQL